MIRIGIFGYGNLAKGVEKAVLKNPDFKLIYVFTRRNPDDVKVLTNGVKVVSAKDVVLYKDEIDVLVLCGGSLSDLPIQTPELVKYFNVIDSFDTHKNIKNHFQNVDKVAKESNHVGLISVGWDPGMFSLVRVISEAALPDGKSYTFWGPGVSQGHSDAIRRIEHVIDARQYTIPLDKALDDVRSLKMPEFKTRDMHKRVCYVVVDDPKNEAYVEEKIKTMPNYFDEYDTEVNFISLDELKKNHNTLPHGGFVLRSGRTSNNTNHVIEYSLKLDSNPEFTASVMVSYARAVYRMAKRGDFGAKTIIDIAPKDISSEDYFELLSHKI